VFHLLARLQKRMGDAATRVQGQVGGKLGDLAREGLGLGGTVEGLLVARGRDQLHGPRDLADVADRLAALDDGACLGHGSLSGGTPSPSKGVTDNTCSYFSGTANAPPRCISFSVPKAEQTPRIRTSSPFLSPAQTSSFAARPTTDISPNPSSRT